MKKKDLFKRIIAAAMTAVMSFAALSADGGTAAVYAQEETAAEESQEGRAEKEISGLGIGGIRKPRYVDKGSSGLQYVKWDRVFFGKYKQGEEVKEPVEWRVLSVDDNPGSLLLLSDKVLDKKNVEYGSDWSDCSLRDWLNNTEKEDSFINSAFEEREQYSIASTPTQNEYEDKLFLLTIDDLHKNEYGFNNEDFDLLGDKWKKATGEDASWWINNNWYDIVYSTGGSPKYALPYVDSHGSPKEWPDPNNMGESYGVRPAMRIDSQNVIAVSTLKADEENSYRLTLKDDEMKITANEVSRIGDDLRIPFAISGKNANKADRVSVLLLRDEYSKGGSAVNTLEDTTANNGIPAFTYIKLDTDLTEGVGTFTLPEAYKELIAGEDYHIYVMAEDENIDAAADFASEPVEILLQIPATAADYEGTYDGMEHGISVEVSASVNATVKYGLKEGEYTLDESPVIKSIKDSPLTVYYKVSAPGYKDVTGSAQVKLTGFIQKLTAPAAKEGLWADGTELTLVTEGSAESGLMQYALGKDDKSAPADGWKETVPTAKEAGTYYVWYRGVGDDKYYDTEAKCVTVTVAEADKKEEQQPEILPETKTPVEVSENKSVTVGGAEVTAQTAVVIPKAVSFTGSRPTKEQLGAVAKDGVIAKVKLVGIEKLIPDLDKDVDVNKLYTVNYVIGKQKAVGKKGSLTIKLKADNGALRAAGVRGKAKKSFKKLIDELNKNYKANPYSFDIVALDLKDAESVKVKAEYARGTAKLTADGKLKKIKSIRISIKVGEKTKTIALSGKKMNKAFTFGAYDAATGTVSVTAAEGGSYSGSRTDAKVTK